MTKKGFTLVEIMIVVGVIAILSAIAVPNYVKARRSAQSATCIANLRQIEHAVAMWALDKNQPGSATPVWADLMPDYIRGDPANPIKCPAGGLYTIGSAAQWPTCSLGNAETKEHILPDHT